MRELRKEYVTEMKHIIQWNILANKENIKIQKL